MSRWFRFYDEALNDPKVQRLTGDQFKAWVNLLCLASKNGGVLPRLDDVTFALRATRDDASDLLNLFCSMGLLDPIEVRDAPMSYEPHNWKERQYKSDRKDPTAAERSKRYRDRKRVALRVTSRDATVSVTATRADTEQKQIQNSEANASGADAPIDHRKRLFSDGLAKIAAMTGKGPDSCRSFVGKCLKAADDNAVTVLGLIEDAERNQVVNPTAWISARLKPQENFNGRRTVHDAAKDLSRQLQRIAEFDEPAPSGLCLEESGTSLRLLPTWRRERS